MQASVLLFRWGSYCWACNLFFEDNGLLFWLPDVLCQPTEVVLWSLLSVEMFFWGICEGESGLPVLFLRHLRTALSLLLHMLSRLLITFLPRSKHLLISWLQSPSTVILEPPKIKSDTVSTVFPSISNEVMGPDAMIFIFWMLSFKPTFSLSSFTFIKRLLSSFSLYAIRVVSSAYLRLLIFLPAILIPGCASSSRAFLMMYSTTHP